MTITSHQNALPTGSVLMEYRLTGLLGAGAFGITYLARDTHLDKDVAIKEYLPSSFAARAPDGSVVPMTQQHAQDFRWGLERFSQEARTLARFSHPNIVRVNRYFEANGTGYMVMDYERGESLKTFVQAHPFPPEATLRAIVGPLLDGLEEVHAAGFLHRDIKPENIFLREDGGAVLIDFGSARQTVGDSRQALTTIVSPGYAPFEQYTTSRQQGPWSDIYSLGGVLYFLVVGQSPPDAITRMKADTLGERLAQAGQRYSSALIGAIAWSLAIEESARPRDVATWRKALEGSPAAARNAPPSSIGLGAVRVEPRVPTTVLAPEEASTVAFHLQRQEPAMLLLAATASEAGAPVDSAALYPRGRNWVFGHVLLIGVTGTLGILIGKLPAFQELQLIEGKLSAAALAQLLGAGSAIVFAWLLGRGVALRFRMAGAPRAVLHDLLMPIVTLASLGIAYPALLKPLGPPLEETLSSICNLAFLVGACACALWLSMAVFSHGEQLWKLLHKDRPTAPGAGDPGSSAWAGSKEK